MKQFTKNDDEFICMNCGKKVEKLGYTSRDHCNHCLCSIHIDINPGDRANDCRGILRPEQVLLDNKKGGYVIEYKCERCGEKHRNKAAEDDDINLLIKYSVGTGLL